MKKLLVLIFLAACSLQFPAQLPENLVSPIRIERDGRILTVYFEPEVDSYSIVGIHPLLGREFLIRVKAGKIVSEEYGFIFSPSEVKQIVAESLNAKKVRSIDLR